jgi:hypothetical protein
MALTAAAIHARTINVRGTVTHHDSGEAMSSIGIYNASTNKILGTTTLDGHYTVSCNDTDTLMFTAVGCEDKIVPVAGSLILNVIMDRDVTTLAELSVKVKRKQKKVEAEPTDIDVIGNWLHIKTRVKIPSHLAGTGVRLIVQPMIVNVTKSYGSYLTPVVSDGYRYNFTQDRMYDYHLEHDSLDQFVRVRHSRPDTVITIVDSTWVDNPSQDYRCDLMIAMENYNRIIYTDTVTIGRGVVNPLRFLALNFKGSFVKDSIFLPSPEILLRDARGDIHLNFAVGKSNLDLDLGNNRTELDKLISDLKLVQDDPDAVLKSIEVSGTASPEGNYETNRRLAKGRLESAMEVVLGNLDKSTYKNANVLTDASVESWLTLAEKMEADSLIDEAAQIREIVKGNKQVNQQYAKISKLPYYKSVIAEKYLPQLRRVEYRVVSSRFCSLSDEEILNNYLNGSSNFSKYEYWRLYSLQEDAQKREELIRQALAKYPDFLVAATDLSACMIEKGTPDAKILAPFFEKQKLKKPNEAYLNQAIALMAENHFSQADSLAQFMPDEEDYHRVKLYSSALTGHYVETIAEISAESPFNEVLMLLAIKDNNHAYEKARKLGDSATEEYVKAVACSRVDEVGEALYHMEKAFEQDPKLRDIAALDGDLLDLLEEQEAYDNEGESGDSATDNGESSESYQTTETNSSKE